MLGIVLGAKAPAHSLAPRRRGPCKSLTLSRRPLAAKEIGIGALVVSLFFTGCGIFQVFGLAEMFGNELSFGLICGGLRVAGIAFMYGLIIYFISLVIRVTQTPRI